MLKFFRIPFATSGDKAAVPDPVDVNGSVTYTEGYGFDYERQETDPAVKYIERTKMNELFFDVTTALAELQSRGVPDFITSALNGGTAYGYAKNALVRYADELYLSRTNGNTANPTDVTNWRPFPSSNLIPLAEFGIKFDGTDETAKLENALLSGERLWHPGGTLLINNEIILPAGCNPSLFGVGARSIIRAGAGFPTATSMMIRWQSASDFMVSGVAIDRNWTAPVVSAPEGGGVLNMLLCSDFSVIQSHLLNILGSGVRAQGCTNFNVLRNRITCASPSQYPSFGVFPTNDGGRSSVYTIAGNRITGTGIQCYGDDFSVIDNHCSGYQFGAGIVTQAAGGANRATIAFNKCHDSGTALDHDGSYQSGIENWAPNSIIHGNHCWRNGSAGINQGGQNCTVTANHCWDNGQANNWDGIVSLYTSVAVNASGSLYEGNVCYDTQGASATQGYGYREQSASLGYITLGKNNFSSGHKFGPESVLGIRGTHDVASNSGSVAWTPGVIPNGTSIGTGVTVAGAKVGDLCVVSFDADIQSCLISGCVNAPNNVVVTIGNLTGGSKTIGAGTLRVEARKPPNFATY